MRASDLLPILDRFLEAVARTRREKALAKATQRAEVAISRAFEEQGMVFIESWARAARRAGLREMGPPPPVDPALALPWEPAFSDAEIATLQLFEEPIQALVEDALLVGAREAIADVSADISFNLANPRAVAFLEQYGAERVTMINETTRDEIRRMVTRGVEQGLSYDQVAKDITARFREFAVGKPQLHIDSRAHLVAVTEAANGYEEGSRGVVGELEAAGIPMEHKWLTVGDSRVSDGCRSNQAAGWVPNGQAFPSGHERPPRFPGCRCTALYQRKRDVAAQVNKQPTTPARPSGASPVSIRFASDNDAIAWGKQHFDRLSPAQKKALESYQDSAYLDMNGYLRGLYSEVDSDVLRDIRHLDKVMDSQRVPENVLAFRGAKVDALNLPTNLDPKALKKLVGQVVEDKGFVSTTLVPEAQGAQLFANSALQFEITVPKGAPGYFVPRGVPGSFSAEECELLLARGTRLMITDAKRIKGKGGQWQAVIKATVVV